jgi:5-hydroxyisourate hydrolase
MHGCPAAGMAVTLYTMAGGVATPARRFTLNVDGRHPDGMLLTHDALRTGQYRLSFAVAAYFRQRGVALPEPPFLDEVHIDFGIAHPDQHYHVPLLCTPWSYSTYRGS